ncbi:MAG: DUF1616 domain-containing protein [Candidatus Heimdallarchaeota archaeon]
MSERTERRKQRLKDRLEAETRQAEIQEIIENILENSQPPDVRTIVELLEKNYDISQEEAIPVLRKMEFATKLTLQESLPEETIMPKTPREYFLKRNYFSIEFWVSTSIILLVLIFVLIDVTEGFFFYFRYVVVSFFMLFLSGWSLTSVMFPSLDDNMRFLERAATAIGLSLFVVIMDGIFLNYTFRFNPVSIGVSLIIVTLICMTISIIFRLKLGRDGYILKKKEQVIEVVEK